MGVVSTGPAAGTGRTLYRGEGLGQHVGFSRGAGWATGVLGVVIMLLRVGQPTV